MKTVTCFAHPYTEIEDCWIPMTDGVRLAGKLWLARWSKRLRTRWISRRPDIGIVAFLLLFVASAPTNAASAAEILKFTHQDVTRTAILYRPASIAEREAPVVIALHGFTASGEWLRAELQLDRVADREQFVTVYPDAVDGAWSFGQSVSLPMPTVGGATVDDIGFIRMLIDDLVKRKIGDPKRIYITGTSRGGSMTYTLACVLGERLAAVAPLIAPMTEHQRDNCQPGRAVPIMAIAGTSDPAMSFDGAQGSVGRLLSVTDTMEFWRSLHGCACSDSRALPSRVPGDATHVTLIEWNGCGSNAKVRLYRVDGGGHQIPSLSLKPSPLPEQRFGPRNHDIETAEALWAFFRNFVAP